MTVREIFNFLNDKFPTESALSFDNVGILIGDPDSTVTKAVLSLDCTEAAVKAAIDEGAELIITHHPVIFEPLKTVLKGSVAYTLIKSDISVISMHTNLDIGIGGVNDSLCAALSLCNVEKITAADGFLINKGSLPSPLTPEKLAEHINNSLGGSVKYSDCTDKINNVLVCSGSGGSYFNEVIPNGCEALITADVKHNIFIDSEKYGVSVFDAGHFDTENIVLEPLSALLQSQFMNTEFIICNESKIKSIA